jgi:hypothetical protein
VKKLVSDQNDQSKNHERKSVTFKRDVGGSISFEGQITQLAIDHQRLERRLCLLIFLIILNVVVSIFNSWPLIDCWPREGWWSFIISLAINGIGFFIGYKALMKVREIRIIRN